MKCDACGKEVAAESAFCPKCGAQLGGDAAGTGKAGSGGGQRFPNSRPRGAGNQPAEEDLWSGTFSPQAMVGSAAGLAVLTVLVLIGGTFAGPPGLGAAGIGALLLWAVWAAVLFYRRMTVHYRLSTFRLFHESGLLNRKRDRIEVIDINDVTLTQGFIERMFNVGTIHIDSSDQSHPDFDMPGIDNVRHVADLIDNTRRAERQRRAVFMENVGPSQG
jgi:membrane protein YdbS with pleckstrin-like domain